MQFAYVPHNSRENRREREIRDRRRSEAARIILGARKLRPTADAIDHMVLDAAVDANIMVYLLSLVETTHEKRMRFIASMFLTGDEREEVGLK